MTKTSAVFPQPAAGVRPTPRVYTEEQKTMIEELRQYALSLLLPETDPYHPNERRWIEEPECPARYMRAAKWKLEDGKRRIKGTIEWRREYKPDLISAEHVKIENDSGKILLNGFDYDGRPIITMRVGRQNTQPSERQILHLIFCLERAIDYMPEGQDSMLILVDYKSATLKSNPSISTALKVLHILQDHYVERLGRAIVTNLPMLLNFFFKGIGPFLDPVTREKMKFNPNLHELIPDEHLEVEFGGKFDYEFNPDSYWEQICRHSGVNADGSRYEPEWKRAQKEQEESPKPVDSETSSTAPDLVADDDDVESSRAPSVQLPRASKPLSVKGGSSGKDGVEVIGEEEPNVLVADLVGVDGGILPATSETPDWLSFRLGGSPQLQPATTAPTLSSSLPLTSPPVPPTLTVQLMSHFSVPPSPPASASSKYTYDSSTTGTATGSHSNHNQHHSLILRRGSPSNQNQHIMHPALLISEIIHSVFSNFTIPGDRATLINLACTCQAFYDIALDYLWKEIRGVTCFSRMLFPEPLNDDLDYDGAWRSRTERFQAVRTERERLISLGLDEKQRTRVMSCARRVRRIAMGDKDMDDPETYTFFAFVAAYPPQPDPTYQDANMSVLPNLRHLHSTVRSIHGITHTIHLLQLTSNKLWDWNGSNNNSGTSSNGATAPVGNESETTPESESGPSQPRPPLPSRSSSTSTLQHTSSLRTLQVSAFVPWTYQTSSQMLVNERYMELARSGAMLTRLQRLEFRVDQVSAAIEIAFADAVVNLKSIRYIDLGLKKHAIGRAIANMAGKLELKDVRLSFSKEDVPGALEPHPSGTFEELFEEAGLMPVKTFADAQAYPVLENLHLSASADCIVDTLRFFDLPNSLLHLQIHPTALSLDDLTFLLEVISTNPSHLKTCVLSDTRLWMNKRTVGAVPPFTMRPMYPLLILTQLETVKIDLDVVYHLTDDDLGDMASAWPNLQVLHICPWKEVEAVSATTLPSFVGLRTLTAGCPNLLELKLKIDASRNVGDVIKSLGKSARARSAELRKWFIGASAIQEEQAETVAEAIHLLFPKLEALGLPREVVGNPAKYEEWTKVHDALRALQPIREDPYLRL